MTEAEARDWVGDRFGYPAVDRLRRFARLLIEESTRQNLIAPSTVEQIWVRHILDSAQLAVLDESEGYWLDVGSGGGLPGIVLALLIDRPFLLCEPRRRRADFMLGAIELLGIAERVTVVQQKVEALSRMATTISARAVASIGTLVAAACHCDTPATTWILPRGKSGQSELRALSPSLRDKFHVKQSITDPDAVILIGIGLCSA